MNRTVPNRPIERFASDFAALRIELQRKCGRGIFAFRQRDVDALNSLRRRLRAQHHAGAAAAGAAECGRELHVLKRLVENQPAALRGLRSAYDLAVFRAPIGIADVRAAPSEDPWKVQSGTKFLFAPARGSTRNMAPIASGCASDLFPHNRSPRPVHFGSANATNFFSPAGGFTPPGGIRAPAGKPGPPTSAKRITRRPFTSYTAGTPTALLGTSREYTTLPVFLSSAYSFDWLSANSTRPPAVTTKPLLGVTLPRSLSLGPACGVSPYGVCHMILPVFRSYAVIVLHGGVMM